MDDLIRIAAVIGLMVGGGVGAYAAVSVISIIRRRLDPPPASGLEELDSIQARLANVESLEARVNELEERVDFAERLIASQHESERLSAGQPPDHR